MGSRACRWGVLAVCCVLIGQVYAVGPTVTNVVARQRTGTKLVDITYDLADPDSAVVNVSIKISKDAGATWNVPCPSLSGNGIGPSVTPGAGKQIVWDAAADWNGQWSDRMQVEVMATDVGDDFALIPAGTFTMGDSFAEGGSDERPTHSVSVSAFYISRYEVTKALWEEVKSWAGSHAYAFENPGAGKGASHPVHTVSWYDVVKWCNARSEKEGLSPCYTVGGYTYRTGDSDGVVCNWSANGYRLPTEAEWEKAARGGLAGRRFPWGAVVTHGHANYYANPTAYGYDENPTSGYHPDYDAGGYPYTSPVGSFGANGHGLYDMAGNLWEWCWDWYDGGYYGSSPGSDPMGPGSGSYRVGRGGRWSSDACGCRVANRGRNSPGYASNYLGFRLVRAAQ